MRPRYRTRRTAAWTAAKLLLLGGAFALGVAVWVLTRPVVNPGVQDCGTTASFYLEGTENVVVRPGEPGAPPDAPALALQPTCRELTDLEVRKASIALAAFFGLTLLGAVVGLVDDRIDYWKAPRFETLLRPMDREQRVGFGLVPDVDPDELGRRLPPLEPLEVIGLLGFGAAAFVALPLAAGSEAWRAALDAIDPGAVAGLVLVTVVAYLAAALARLGVLPTTTGPLGLLRLVVASAWSGRLRPYVGTFGVDLHELRRQGRRRGESLAAVRTLEAGAGVVHVVLLGAALWSASSLDPGDHEYSLSTLLLAGGAGFFLLYGLTTLGRRLRALPVLPGRAGLRGLRDLARRPAALVALVAGSAAQTVLTGALLAAGLAVASASAPFGAVLAVALVAVTLAPVAPTPNGAGVVEAILMTGLVLVGVDPGAAAVATLASRLVGFWAPMLPGLVAARVGAATHAEGGTGAERAARAAREDAGTRS